MYHKNVCLDYGGKMVIGIPRALLYYKNEKLWTNFFTNCGIDYIISPETNKEILKKGENYAIDETCLPTKVFLGAVDWLIGKCDMVFVPRQEFGEGCQMCTKFLGIIELSQHTFRDRDVKWLSYDLRKKDEDAELNAFLKLGNSLGLEPEKVAEAYKKAKQSQIEYEQNRIDEQMKQIQEVSGNKVLVVAHAYNITDKLVGAPVIKALEDLGCLPVFAEYVDKPKAMELSKNFSRTLPWGYSKQLVGAIDIYKPYIDGIVLLTTFPCGPDSMVNEMILHKVKDVPILVLTVEAQDSDVGVQTRLESFVDIINFKKEKDNE